MFSIFSIYKHSYWNKLKRPSVFLYLFFSSRFMQIVDCVVFTFVIVFIQKMNYQETINFIFLFIQYHLAVVEYTIIIINNREQYQMGKLHQIVERFCPFFFYFHNNNLYSSWLSHHITWLDIFKLFLIDFSERNNLFHIHCFHMLVCVRLPSSMIEDVRLNGWESVKIAQMHSLFIISEILGFKIILYFFSVTQTHIFLSNPILYI